MNISKKTIWEFIVAFTSMGFLDIVVGIESFLVKLAISGVIYLIFRQYWVRVVEK